VLNDYRGKHYEWSDEWFQSACAPTASCGSFFATTVTGSASGAGVFGSPGASRLGVISLNTGTLAVNAAALTTSQAVQFDANSSSVFEATIGVPTLSTSSEEFAVQAGFSDSAIASNNATDGCYFLYDRGNVATSGCNTGNANKWEAVCAQAGTRTIVLLDGTSQNGACAAGSITTVSSAVAASTLPDTNIYHLKIVVTSASSAVFSINGVTVATLTTNIPSTSTNMTSVIIGLLKSAGTTSRSLLLDYSRVAFDQTSARTP
jgi:hypothetical protein